MRIGLGSWYSIRQAKRQHSSRLALVPDQLCRTRKLLVRRARPCQKDSNVWNVMCLNAHPHTWFACSTILGSGGQP